MAKGELRKGRIRVSYIEEASIREALEKEDALTGPTRVAKRNRKRD